MTQSSGIAHIFGSAVYSLNPENCDAMYRKIRALPVTKRSHLNVVAGVIRSKAMARPKYIKLYATMCARLINGGFDGARPGSGPAFQTALLPKCYDDLKECCKISETRQCSERRANDFISNCQFIGELFKFGVYPKEIVWSFVNDLVNGHACEVQVRCLCALLTLVAPKLSETYFVTREMLLEMQRNLNSTITSVSDVLDDEYGTSVITECREEVNGDAMQPAIETSIDSVNPEPSSDSIIISANRDITANNDSLTFNEAQGGFAFRQRYYTTLSYSSVGFPLTGSLFSPISEKCFNSKQGPLPGVSLDMIDSSIPDGPTRDRWSVGALLSSKSTVTGVLVGFSIAWLVKIVPAVLRKWVF
ncbi:Armadillo-type fold,MIF4G-like, type 3 [Cinara cedri]|uniref:Armadillo-type fold,MIF4G-like, type 3 n=1 Tax=Cinara cedri TaxID=506608 RepID=A0A5E4N7T1_9HEMI|nr:Armadillo-type fold,MIF4G-like, type 3 [Cinara cedri]